jgi:signal transduction histidine kinase
VNGKGMRARLLLPVVLLAVGMLGPLVAWFITGWSGVRRGQAEVDRAVVESLRAQETSIADRIAAILQVLRERESRRPYFHYQSLYHDPRGADLGASIVTSPLVEGPTDPLVETYFQIDSQGLLTVPTYNEDVPTLNIGPNAGEGQKVLALLRPVASELVKLGAEGAPASPAPAPSSSAKAEVVAQNDLGNQQGSIQQVLDNNSFAQNKDANQIYNQIKKQKKSSNEATVGEVVVTIEPFRFAVASIGGAPRILAVRGVETPAGRSTQGFLISTAGLATWLAMPPDAEVRASTDASPAIDDDVAVSLPLLRGALHVVVPPPDASVASGAKTAVARDFLVRFVPVSLATMIACGLALLVVAKTERLAQQRSQFAASAAHELRTPLAGLRLYAEMLEGGLGDPEKAGDYARRIGEEAARLGRVVGNVLGFSQLERGAITVRRSRQDLAAWLTDDVARMAPGVEALGAKLELAIDVDPLEASFDADAMGQIVQNLVDNAEKYSREAKDRTIHVHLRVKDSLACIEVRDHGPGIPRSQRESLFVPFVRGELVDQPAGVGLGLSISRALARAQGGDLTLLDATDGARFMVTLPTAG